MSIVEFGTIDEAKHVVVVLKTDDGEVHVMEWGKEAAAAGPSHAHHDKRNTDTVQKHGHHGHEHHKEEAHGAETGHDYPVKYYSPASLRPGGAPPMPALSAAKTAGVKPDVLHHDLKHHWHHHHDNRFADGHHFAAFVAKEKLGA